MDDLEKIKRIRIAHELELAEFTERLNRENEEHDITLEIGKIVSELFERDANTSISRPISGTDYVVHFASRDFSDPVLLEALRKANHE